jgi:formylglycine-generating enzyme required for sulfatase activity/tRNA A-37 threonylcarbamoyl transferase component Bud32/dienelactone hydrolase
LSQSRTNLFTSLSDRYRLERELGRGGMATVYLAYDLKHGRQVAIKTLHPELSAYLGADRFLREIQVIARLTHPHILPLHDSGEADGTLFYVMPFVEGESLRDLLRREKQLPLDLALRITREVADALHYAHQHGVIHRDIKPENILLQAGHAVVADFGIARAVDAAGGEKLTETGLALGTPAYMSPEQASGDRVDARSDLYSLACVLYEMLAGQPPFTGPTGESVLRQHLIADLPDVSRIRPVPTPVAATLARAMAKTPADRFSDTQEFADALTLTGPLPATAAVSERVTPGRRSRWLLPLGVLGIVVLLALLEATTRMGRSLWARTRIIPAIQRSVTTGDWESAYRLAAKADRILPGDSTVAALRSVFTDTMRIEGTPSGAQVYRRAYAAGRDDWQLLGRAPIQRVTLPRLPQVSQFRFEAPGFASGFEIGAPSPGAGRGRSLLRFALVPAAAAPQGMVLVLAGQVFPGIPQLPALSVTLPDFYLDRLETTNREYQVFVDSGGYRRREFWVHPFELDGRRLTWEEAMKRLVDQTGRAGPSTWEAGHYPDGRADHPVSGVSWYEADAYARFRGKRLPNVFQWSHAARFDASGSIIAASNIGRVREGTAPVGSFGGMAGSGALDMAGNVREWCSNESKSQKGRYILGGGWNDPAHRYFESAIQSAFNRDPSNGIRLARPVSGQADIGRSNDAIEPIFRDYRKERPVPEATFRFYRRLFAYDPLPLDTRVERRDSTAQWHREKVSYDAGYGGERLPAYVFLPRRGRPPYQAVVFFPGSLPLRVRSSERLVNEELFDFLVQDGRAVIYPVYRGTYERDDGTRFSDPDPSNRYKEHVIQWQREVSRTVDYLASRGDIDTTRIAYLGFSWGGRLGGVMLAIEQRFKAAVLVVAGLNFRSAQPEVDDINYMPHVRAPVLMLNGRHDNTFPLETAVKPMYDLLGTPPDQKRNVVAEGVHYVPRTVFMGETLAWLDRYLGTVRR